MGAAIKHKYISPKSQSADPTLVSKNEWNDEHLFDPPATGALLAGKTDETSKAAWISPAAVGRVLISQGAAALPVWSDTLALAGLTAGRIPYIGTAGLIKDEADLQWDETANALKIGGVAPGTGFSKGLVLGVGTVPTTFPAGAVQLVAVDLDGANTGVLRLYDEQGARYTLGSAEPGQGRFKIEDPAFLGSQLHFIVEPFQSLILAGGPFKLGIGATENLALMGDGNVGLGTGSFGTNASRTLAALLGGIPTSGQGDIAQLTANDEAVAGGTGWIITEEQGTTLRLGGEVIACRLAGNPAVNVVSTAAETSIYGGSPPTILANTLGTFRALRIEIMGDFLNNTGAGDKFTIRIKYGGVTIATIATTDYTSSATRYQWQLALMLAAAGATNAQVLEGALWCPSTVGVSGTSVAHTGNHQVVLNNAVAVDETADQVLDITIQNDTSSANESTRVFAAKVHLE